MKLHAKSEWTVIHGRRIYFYLEPLDLIFPLVLPKTTL